MDATETPAATGGDKTEQTETADTTASAAGTGTPSEAVPPTEVKNAKDDKVVDAAAAAKTAKTAPSDNTAAEVKPPTATPSAAEEATAKGDVQVAPTGTTASPGTAPNTASPPKPTSDGKLKPSPAAAKSGSSVAAVAAAPTSTATSTVAKPAPAASGAASAARVPSSTSTSTASKSSEGGGGGGGSGVKSLKKGARKKRKTAVAAAMDRPAGGAPVGDESGQVKKRKAIKRPKKDDPSAGKALKKKARPGVAVVTKKPTLGVVAVAAYADHGLSAAQIAVNEQMRRALEEDQYSAHGSIVESDSEDDEQKFVYKGNTVRLDRSFMLQTARKHNWTGGLYNSSSLRRGGDKSQADIDDDEEEEILQSSSSGVIEGVAGSDSPIKGPSGKKNIKATRRSKGRAGGRKDSDNISGKDDGVSTRDKTSGASSSGGDNPIEHERDEGSIFGQTTGASNSTWVECDKCKKWRRLRGVVDERKLPPKWYCSMNKNDPARARCSAPEEEYDSPQTAESAADSRTRKHLRVWVRRLQVNEQYEARQPTLTRGKKKSATSSKEPFEWVRCCNPSCGKWRAVLRIMDAKQSVVDQTADGEWYCVMNTWDEKTASCAAPQENLPAVGLPPWCLVDEN